MSEAPMEGGGSGRRMRSGRRAGGSAELGSGEGRGGRRNFPMQCYDSTEYTEESQMNLVAQVLSHTKRFQSRFAKVNSHTNSST